MARRNLIPVLSLLFAALLVPVSSGAEDFVVGMSAAFTGPSRGLGIELYRGSMAYLEHANRSGLLPGRRLVIRAYDDGYQPEPAVRNTLRLIEDDKVFLLFDYVGTPTVARVLPLLLHQKYRREKIYLAFPFTGADLQRQPPYENFVFNLRASYRQETKGLVDHLVRLNRKRIAVYYQVDAYGRTGWDGVRHALDEHGLKMVGEATYCRGDRFQKDFSRQVEILREASPDAIISVGAYAACAGFIRDVRNAGWDVPIANLSFVDSDNMLTLLRGAEDSPGKYTRNLINSQVVPCYEDLHLPAVAEYRRLMDQYDPNPPAHLLRGDYQAHPYSFVSFEGFLNAKVLVQALAGMKGEVGGDRFAASMEALDRIDLGIDAPVGFGLDRRQGMDEVYYTTVEEGRQAPLVHWERWGK